MTLALAPFPVDLSAALALAEDAMRARLAPGEKLSELLPPLASAIRTGRASGGLLRIDGLTCGVVAWVPAGPLGTAVRLFHLAPPYAQIDRYRTALDVVEHAAGPIAFLAGQLSGLTESEESALLEERGFAPYGRSELSLAPATPVPPPRVSSGVELRPVRPGDEPALARLHERAYEDHLDRFLALEALDPVHDADRQLRDYFAGRYGEILSPGSSVATSGGRIVAAVISTQFGPPDRALIIDVMTDPDRQGTGLGRAVLSDAVRALRGRGETAIVLNVTEGNYPAVHLYARLGFVRSMGPTREWYDARRMPVRYPRGAARPP